MTAQTILSSRRPSAWRIPGTNCWRFFCLGDAHGGHLHQSEDFASEAEALAAWPLCSKCAGRHGDLVALMSDKLKHDVEAMAT